MTPVRLTVSGGVAVLSLNRPDRLNAINTALRDAFLDALARIDADPELRCVILRAEGRLFCAGQDLEERRPIVEGRPLDLGAALRGGINRMILGLSGLRQPVVACLQGDAVGAGASLVLACDLIHARAEARLHFSFARLGLGPDSGASWLLPVRIGHARAAEVMFCAKPLAAMQACQWGLVNACHAPDVLEDAVADCAREIAELPREAVGAAKALLSAAPATDLAGQLEKEAEAQSRLGKSTIYRERLAAFLSR